MFPTEYRKRLEQALWRDRGAETPGWKSLAVRVMRTAAVLVRDNTGGDLTLRSMGLVYATLLSLVPLLALSFSVLKAFGVHNRIRFLLEEVLAPLGERSNELADLIITFIENMNVGVLGFMGLALLIYTAVSVVQKVEESFNFIWHIGQSRSFGERFSRYLTLLLVGPILVFAAMGITASVLNTEIVQWFMTIDPFGRIFVSLSRLTPYILVIAAFSVAYYFIPNTTVRPSAALLGGVVAGIAWQTAGWIFAEFAASSRQYRAIYSSFAILILFMIWLYLSWRILLFGAGVAFYCQHPEYLVARGGEPRLSNRMRERLALQLISLIAGRFMSGQPPLTRHDLARRLRAPEHVIQVILDALEEQELLTRVGNGPLAYLPTRDLGNIGIGQFLRIVRSVGESRFLKPDDLPLHLQVREAMERMEEASERAVDGISLLDIAEPFNGEDPADCSRKKPIAPDSNYQQ